MSKIFTNISKLIKDETAGPGLEEALLLAFIGVVVCGSAKTLGETIGQVFNTSTDSLKTALGVK